MKTIRFAWMIGACALAACSDDTGASNTTGTGSTGASTGTGSTQTGSSSSGSAGASTSSTAAGTGTGGDTTTSGTSSTTSAATGAGGATGSTSTAAGGGTGVGGSGTGGGAGGATTGTGGGKTDAGSTGGSGMMDASTGGDAIAPGGCSEPGPDPAPPAGFTKAQPLDAKFPFSTHFMGVFGDPTAATATNPRCISMTSLTDIDKDGDLDFADGQRDVACSGASNPGNPMIWWEYCSPDHWVRHLAGKGFASAASGGAADFDGDGWIDLVAGDSWFKNPGGSSQAVRAAKQWTAYKTGAPGATEEITMGDLNNDGKLDALYVVQTIKPQWWAPGANPATAWTKGAEFPYSQQQGGAIADLDGDGKNDAIVGSHWWYRGTTWTPVPIATDSTANNPAFVTLGGFEPSNTTQDGSAPLVMPGDIDGDGDIDLAMSTHWGYNVAWVENKDGKGTAWVLHTVPPTARSTSGNNVLHDTVTDDFDNDGDLDIMVAENNGTLWIYENVDGKGTMWAEHKIATGPGHEARAADVDCDGDLDIVGKSWGDPNDGKAGASENPDPTKRYHVYYKNELVERGGKAVFDRPKGEVWNVPNKGRCK